MTLPTNAGKVGVEVVHGQDGQTGQWFSPACLAWGLKPRSPPGMTPHRTAKPPRLATPTSLFILF